MDPLEEAIDVVVSSRKKPREYCSLSVSPRTSRCHLIKQRSPRRLQHSAPIRRNLDRLSSQKFRDFNQTKSTMPCKRMVNIFHLKKVFLPPSILKLFQMKEIVVIQFYTYKFLFLLLYKDFVALLSFCFLKCLDEVLRITRDLNLLEACPRKRCLKQLSQASIVELHKVHLQIIRSSVENTRNTNNLHLITTS